LYLYSR